MLFICFVVLAVVVVLVMEQSRRDDFDKFLSDHVQKSVIALKHQ